MRLTIAHSWSGEPLPEAQQAHVQLAPAPGGWSITVDAPFYDDPAPAAAPGPTWQLWQHEVVELFIAGADASYLEVELGPHGHHLVLTLSGVRAIDKRELPLSYSVERAGGRWQGQAHLPASYVPSGPHRVAAFAIHGPAQSRSYLAHPPLPGPAPDFHQPHRYLALNLPSPGAQVHPPPRSPT